MFVHVWTLDVILGAAETGMLEPRWSKDVTLEVERAFSEVRPGSEDQARAMMAAAGRAYPDDVLMRMVETDPDVMRATMQNLVRTKAHPPRTMAEEIAGLRRNRLERFSDWLAS